MRIYYAPKEHPPPHFHVYYGDCHATVSIVDCEIRDGQLPSRQRKLVLAWAELHQEALLANWQLLMNGERPFPIDPLK